MDEATFAIDFESSHAIENRLLNEDDVTLINIGYTIMPIWSKIRRNH